MRERGVAPVWGLRKQIGPLIADGHETLAVARETLDVLTAVAAAVLVLQLLILAAVLHGR